MGSNLITEKHKFCQGSRAAAAHAEPEPAQAVLDPCSSGQAALRNKAKSERSEANVQTRLFSFLFFFGVSELTC